VVRRRESGIGERDLLTFLEERVAKWWLPDRVVFVEEIPKTGTGKFDKKVVRNEYADLLMDDG
jgi:fatty-acyl-CoA synthase